MHAKPLQKKLKVSARKFNWKEFPLYFQRHFAAACLSFKRLKKTPLATLMTIMVIGIALSLPLGLSTLLNNLELISQPWKSSNQISLFLQQSTSLEEAASLADQLAQQQDIATTQVLSPAQGLDFLETATGLNELINLLPENPLPSVIMITPVETSSPTQLDTLVNRLEEFPQVEYVELDRLWLERLQHFIELAQRGIYTLSILLGFAVILVIGNTIRLITQNAREEIYITRSIGATNGFIRRPFLYTGFYYGIFGALIACILVIFGLIWLEGPTQALAQLYNSDFSLQGLTPQTLFFNFLISSLLGICGAWAASNQLLKSADTVAQ